jgi:4-hydroxy-3-polyprenylbenzoate decarboxylase
MRRHIDMWREKGADRMPAAVVIGAQPHLVYTACTRVPNDLCEYDVAGALSGRPLTLVRCKTQDLLVPSEAEIVIEGTVPLDMLEIEGAFGEFAGYMAKRDYNFFMDVTCITMRQNPIYLSIVSQVPPSESSKMRQIGMGAAGKKMLHDAGYTTVIDINYLECAGARPFVVVKIKKNAPDDGRKILKALAEKFIGKIAIAVDDDIDIYDLENIAWAIAYRAQPYRDMEIFDTPLFTLDPSVSPPENARGLLEEHTPRSSALMIDATLPWPYSPISLPRKEYMDRAISLWKEMQFPALDLKDPWYGRSLGQWTAEEEDEADLAVQGRYYETGEKLRQSRRSFPK